jgi:hypothetical protein
VRFRQYSRVLITKGNFKGEFGTVTHVFSDGSVDVYLDKPRKCGIVISDDNWIEFDDTTLLHLGADSVTLVTAFSKIIYE